MKQIIPFVKDLELETKISEITSIALEHNLTMENDDSIVGDFVVSGKYKINDVSISEEVFEKVIPFDITLDDKYDTNKVKIDIDDFYYEIINDEYLRVHIDVLVDNLVYVKEKKELPKEIDMKPIYDIKDELTRELNQMDENNNEGEDNKMINDSEKEVLENKEEEKKEETVDSVDIVNNLSNSFLQVEDKYVTYKVHIVREDETIEQIKEKYKISTEELEKYNSLDNIMIGTKLIIPAKDE